MKWIIIAVLALAAAIAIGLLVKWRLKKRLDDIDGFHGSHREDQVNGEGSIIGSLGENQKDKK